MELILRCAALCVVGSILALLLKRHSPELSPLIALCTCVCALGLCARIAEEIGETLRAFSLSESVESTAATPVVKCLVIALCTEIAKELCKDAGESTLGSVAEICGTLCALYAMLPLLRSLLAVVGELV